MSKDSREDILNREIDFSVISLFSKKLRIGVVGAGVGGYIKTKHFLNEGCYVEVLSTEFNEKFNGLEGNLKLIKGEYNESFIRDKHIIIIAMENKQKVIMDCQKLSKIYIDSTSFKEGMGSVPVQEEFDNFILSVNTKGGNPKASLMLAKKAKDALEKYDDYVEFTTIIRNKVKKIPDLKKEVINFISSEDFLLFYEKGKASEILDMFYKEKMDGECIWK